MHDLARINGRKLDALIDAGISEVADVPDGFELSDKQATQVHVAKAGKPEIDRAGIAAFMNAITLPATFLDFETHNPAVPRFEGYRPYQQIPFQFSLHILDRWRSVLTHHEFLNLETSEPDHLFMDALQSVLPRSDAVIVWNKSFERSRLAEIAARNPENTAFVDDVTTRLVNLADIFPSSSMCIPNSTAAIR